MFTNFREVDDDDGGKETLTVDCSAVTRPEGRKVLLYNHISLFVYIDYFLLHNSKSSFTLLSLILLSSLYFITVPDMVVDIENF